MRLLNVVQVQVWILPGLHLVKTGHYIAHAHYMFYVRVLVVRWVTLQYFKLLVPKVTADNVSFSMGTNFCVKCNWIAKRNVIWRERKERNYALRSSRAVSTFIDLQLCILPTYYEKISLKLASFQTQALKCCARSGKNCISLICQNSATRH